MLLASGTGFAPVKALILRVYYSRYGELALRLLAPLRNILRQRRVFDQAQVVLGLHLLGAGGLAPFGHDLGPLQQALRLAEFGGRHDQGRHTLAPGAARAAGPV